MNKNSEEKIGLYKTEMYVTLVYKLYVMKLFHFKMDNKFGHKMYESVRQKYDII